MSHVFPETTDPLLLDHYTSHSKYSLNEMKELLDENWPTVQRLGKRVERYASLTVHLFRAALSREFCLGYKDSSVLGQILSSCCEEENDIVSWSKLRAASQNHTSQSDAAKSSSVKASPFAVRGDHLFSQRQQQGDVEGKKAAFRAALFAAVNGQKVVSRKQFHRALDEIEHFGISEREAGELFAILDPKRTGNINVSEFCDRYTVEFLKPKSMRNTLSATASNGRAASFQWQGAEGSLATPISSSSAAALGGVAAPAAPQPAANSSPNKTRASASPRKGERSPRSPPSSGAVKATRASALRKETGTIFRKMGDDGDYFNQQLALLAKPSSSQSAVRPNTARATMNPATGSIAFRLPRPPPARGVRVKTEIIADPRMMGNTHHQRRQVGDAC